VSGGSIAAAHLVLNWERYTATKDAAFQEAANELVDFAGLDLRGKILRRAPLGWIPPFYFARTQQLARGYGKLFKNLMLESLTATGRPRLRILATNMVSGELYFFDAAGIHKIDAAGIVSQVGAAADLPIGVAVAASSAFPPFFPPVKLEPRKLGITGTRMRSVERFTDGGVFDNTGVRAALAVAASGRLVVSDASAGFDQATDQAFRIVISRAIRSSDILMSRVSALEDEHLRRINPSFVSCNISDFITNNDLPGINVSGGVQTQSPAVQKWIKNVRTDLDKFPMPLIQPIFRHGYETGLRLGPQLSPGGQFVITHPMWSPGDTRSKAQIKLQAAVAKIESTFRLARTGVAPSDSVATERQVIQALKRGARRWIGWRTAGMLLSVCALILIVAAKVFYWDQRPRPPDLTARWDAVDAGSQRSESLRRILDDAGLWPITRRLTEEAYAFRDQNDVSGSVALLLVRSPTFAHPVSRFDACPRTSAADVRLFPAALVLRDDRGGAFTKPARVYGEPGGPLKLQVPAAARHSYVVILVAAVPIKPGVDSTQTLDQLESWRVCDENRR
ncbi:MAG: patatin-like phospholipase family protein, partial [Burkholderiales bacterium]